MFPFVLRQNKDCKHERKKEKRKRREKRKGEGEGEGRGRGRGREREREREKRERERESFKLKNNFQNWFSFIFFENRYILIFRFNKNWFQRIVQDLSSGLLEWKVRHKRMQTIVKKLRLFLFGFTSIERRRVVFSRFDAHIPLTDPIIHCK